jgi:putative transposase
VTFAFIAAQKATDAQMNIAWACRTLGVSTSGYYDWTRAQAQPCQRHRDDEELRATIAEIHVQSRGTYGSPRVHAELRLGRDIRVGRKRVERLMRAEGLQGVTPASAARLHQTRRSRRAE